jgi:hypothetical protein
MASGDRDFLRAFAAGQPARQKDETVEEYAKRIGADPGSPADVKAEQAAKPQPSPAPARAQKLDRQSAEAKRAADAETRAQQEKQEKTANLIGKGLHVAGIGPNRAADTVERWRDRLANLPTPGGSGAMLLLLLAFIAFIIPVSASYTRAQLLWLTLLGRTTLQDATSQGSEPRRTTTPVSEQTAPTTPVSEPRATVVAQPIPITLPMPGGVGGPTLPT